MDKLATVNRMEHEPQRTVADYWREGGVEAIFGRRVRQLRQDRNWSQEELADRLTQAGLQFHQTQVGKLESGARPIRLNEAQALSLIFNLPLSDLLDDPLTPKQDPFTDQILNSSVKLRSLQEQHLNALHALENAQQVFTHTGNEVKSEIKRLGSLYAAPVTVCPVDNDARREGLFEVRRTKAECFTWNLSIKGEFVLGGRSNYRDIDSVLLDILAVRYIALMVPENKANRVGQIQTVRTSEGRHYVAISGREGPFASGSEKSRKSLDIDIQNYRRVAPQAPINIRQIEGIKDIRWFSIAAYLPPGKLTFDYELAERKNGQYEYVCRYDAGPSDAGIARAAGGFHSRLQAIRQIQKDREKMPGTVHERRGNIRDLVDPEFELQFGVDGYLSMTPTTGDPVDLAW